MRSLSLVTVFAALSGFAVTFIAPQILSTEQTQQFVALWSLFFALTGLIDGLTQETTRAVSMSRETGVHGSARPWQVALYTGAAVALALLATAWLWTSSLAPDHGPLAGILLAAGLLSYAFQAALSGMLSGLKLWNQFAGLLALDSGIRLGLVLLAWLFNWPFWVFVLITVIGAVSWLIVLLASTKSRTAAEAATDVDGKRFRQNAAKAMLATGATALLITGFPFAMQIALSGARSELVTLGGLMYGVMLTRAPILVPLQRFQSALIVNFVEKRDSVFKALTKPVAAVLLLGIVGAVAAWLVGSWIMDLLFTDDLVVPGAILAVLTLGSACTGVLMITSTAAIAAEQHRLYILGWAVASCVAFGILFTPIGMPTAVCAALLVGPLSGVVIHLLGLRLAARTD